jgi:signal transduction histidine kinase
MKRWLQRLCVFLLIAALVAGGLGWATAESLKMEGQRRQSAARDKHAEKLRLALWRLDGKMAPLLAREDSRPYAHFTPLHAPIPALTNQMDIEEPGRIRLPSPLMEAELPPWMLLHFHVDAKSGWQSPQVLPEVLARKLSWPPSKLTLPNVTPERAELLQQISTRYPHGTLLAELKKRGELPTIADPSPDVWTNNPVNPGQPTSNSAQNAQPANQPVAQAPEIRGQQQMMNADQARQTDVYQRSKIANRGGKGAESYIDLDSITSSKNMSCEIHEVKLSPMIPIWMPSAENPELLFFVRRAQSGSRDVLQGVVLNWPELRDELLESVTDLFPDATLSPIQDGPAPLSERTMTALPIQLDPGPMPAPRPPGWTPLRFGLCLAWVAAIVALLAVGFGGWSLIDLSERRIRFVSAVTHELRTPLTTLRLYLDMLSSGMVREEKQRDEYLATLCTESERLHRLISNVLDFARLEKQQAKPDPQPVTVTNLLEQLRATWQNRCDKAGKELIVETTLPPETTVRTDSALVQQIAGNLIDNACKYSRTAADRRVWLRAAPSGSRQIVFEVEDCGPGINSSERRSVFRPFRRGCSADVTAGGVGLGLALARRWTQMLGGRLDVCKGACAGGACFRLELPA